MGFIDNARGGKTIREPQVAEEGIYTLTVNKVEKVKSKSDPTRHNLRFLISVKGRPDIKNIFHYCAIPDIDRDDPEKFEVKMLMLKRTLVHFEIPFDEDTFDFEESDAKGSTFESGISIEAYEGRRSNKVDIPALDEEDDDSGDGDLTDGPKFF